MWIRGSLQNPTEHRKHKVSICIYTYVGRWFYILSFWHGPFFEKSIVFWGKPSVCLLRLKWSSHLSIWIVFLKKLRPLKLYINAPTKFSGFKFSLWKWYLANFHQKPAKFTWLVLKPRRSLTHLLVIQNLLVPKCSSHELFLMNAFIKFASRNNRPNQKSWARPTGMLKLGHISDSSSDISEAWWPQAALAPKANISAERGTGRFT